MRAVLLSLCLFALLSIVYVSCAPTAFGAASIRSRSSAHPNLVARFTFEEDDTGILTIRGMITGWTVSTSDQVWALHVHQYGDISTMLNVAADGKSITNQQGAINTNASTGIAVGSHFNPDGNPHGCWDSPNPNYNRHAGDIGNVTIPANAASSEVLLLTFDPIQSALISLNPDNSNTHHGVKHGIIGRALVLHSLFDNCGQPTGNAGAPIGAGVIGVAYPANSLIATSGGTCASSTFNYPNTTNGNGNCNKADYESLTGGNSVGNPSFNGAAASAVAVLFKTEKYYSTLPANANTIGTEIGGVVRFQAVTQGTLDPTVKNVHVKGAFAGLGANKDYGVHVHLWGDDSDSLVALRGGTTGASPTGAINTTAISGYDGANYAKGHWNPKLTTHNLDITSTNRHAGDLGNFHTDANGVGIIDVTVDLLALGFDATTFGTSFNQHASIIGRGIVVHNLADTGAQPTGAAGNRQMVGVIGLSNGDINVNNAFYNQYQAGGALANVSVQWIVFIVAGLFAYFTMQY